jgi:diaminopimelate decarboxylase
MDHFQYRGGALNAEDVPLSRIAADVATPFYCYSTATLERHYRVFQEAFGKRPVTICFAVKANSNLAVIRTLASLGAGADVVSVGEMKRALKAGVPASRIVYSGVGKTEQEMAAALDAGIFQFNVESDVELAQLDRVARAKGTKAPVAFRINPDVDALTHAKIATGKSETKFGIDWTRAREIYAMAAKLPGVRVQGIAMHIGSQLTDLAPFKEAFGRLRDLVKALRADGHPIERVDLGGGLGIPYGGTYPSAPDPVAYARTILEAVGDLDCHLVLEPGRLLVGNAGVLVTRVLYLKKTATKTFAVVDAAMNDLLRPALYDAYHEIVPVAEASPGAHLNKMDVVGPVCETGDILGLERSLPPLAPGDLLAIRTAGAYGAVMSSTYNARPLVPEVLVKGDDFAVIRRRVEVDEMLSWESFPHWMNLPAKDGR